MNYDKKLEALRAVIAAECDDRMARDHKLTPADVAAWLVRHKRAAVIDGLTDLVCQVMEQWNDDDRVKRVLRAKPELRERESAIRQLSRTLGVPAWYLLEFGDERIVRCCDAAELIHALRIEEKIATRDAMIRAEEFLRPVTDGHPSMTVRDALQEIERQTDETIRGLEPPPEAA
jgi:hypothetical protein